MLLRRVARTVARLRRTRGLARLVAEADAGPHGRDEVRPHVAAADTRGLVRDHGVSEQCRAREADERRLALNARDCFCYITGNGYDLTPPGQNGHRSAR